MQHYRLLKLPANPLTKDGFKAVTEGSVGNRVYLCFENVHQLLKPELLKTFEDLGVQPYFLTSFGVENKNTGDEHTRLIHSDIRLDRSTKSWIPIPLGINWELTPGTTVFRWWKVDSPEVLPTEVDVPRTIELLAGAHYHERFRTGIHDDAHLLEEVQLTQPTMVRTDVAHSVVFNSNARTRHGISLRFRTEDIGTWEQALEIFKPLFV